LFVQQSFPKRKTYKNFFLSQEIIMKTKFFLKAISTVAMVSLIIGTFFSLTPLRVSASPSNSTVDQWPPTPSIKVYQLENWVSAGFWPLDTIHGAPLASHSSWVQASFCSQARLSRLRMGPPPKF
jgi:hypothetical protein